MKQYMTWSVILVSGSLFASACSKKEDDADTAPKFALIGAGSTSSADASTDAGLDPLYLKNKVYSFSVSESEYCTDPITIFENDDPENSDFLGGPSLGSGTLAEGTYNCVIIEMSDQMSFSPKSTDGACEMDTNYDMNVCREGKVVLTDGTEVECDAGENRVALYLSTASKNLGTQASRVEANCEENEGDNCSAFRPTSEAKPYQGFRLASALEVAGDTVGVFIVDGTGKIGEEQGPDGGQDAPLTCGMQPPTFTFAAGAAE